MKWSPPMIALAIGAVAGIGALALHAKAEADKPPGEKAKIGDDAEFDLAMAVGVLDLPPGASHAMLRVLAVGPTSLGGNLIGVFVPDLMGGPPQLQPVPPNAVNTNLTIPKAAVVAILHDGKAV